MKLLIALLLVVSIAKAQHSGYNYHPINSGSAIASQPIHTPGSSVRVPVEQPQKPQHTIEEVNKQFYTYSAPEEEFSAPQPEPTGPSVSKKNLQVIFIHTPEQPGLNRALQNLARHTSEQQTAIYVLTKQPDLSKLSHSLQRESNHVSSKPEVHFVKYRTPEEAQYAQQSIRAQYDAFSGTTFNSADSVAPVLNFASQNSHQSVEPTSNQGAEVPSINYLPIRF